MPEFPRFPLLPPDEPDTSRFRPASWESHPLDTAPEIDPEIKIVLPAEDAAELLSPEAPGVGIEIVIAPEGIVIPVDTPIEAPSGKRNKPGGDDRTDDPGALDNYQPGQGFLDDTYNPTRITLLDTGQNPARPKQHDPFKKDL